MAADLEAGNRSLERGIRILRAFRPGVDTLGNGEIAERTGLAKATVSRLTRTLVQQGMLDHVRALRAYRLSASVVSFGHAMQMGSPVLTSIGPLMRAESAKRKLNVGLAAADGHMMVYLESVRYNARVALRSVVAGQLVPMELTSLGRAYLAGLPEPNREKLLLRFTRKRLEETQTLHRDIRRSIEEVGNLGYCAVSWQPGVLAVATPIVVEGLPVYAVNMSQQNIEPSERLASEMGLHLLNFANRCKEALSGQ